jgi:hypothetical protein
MDKAWEFEFYGRRNPTEEYWVQVGIELTTSHFHNRGTDVVNKLQSPPNFPHEPI